ncbi:ARM repeat superfamily protein [Striga hermonthica]|uniref:ARM repeat superfamily protein n=1 Tax=Striga hermonthica TaxID=68872 RepID=A0A9N7R7Y6_STRHE|nr:ARM repeat superfamily protein [Striga hermonthica]
MVERILMTFISFAYNVYSFCTVYNSIAYPLSFRNKALMVEAGLLSRLPNNNINALDETSKQELAHLLLSVSSLAKSKFSLDSSKIVPTLLFILDSTTSSCTETKKTCLTALYNLSSVLENTEILISNGTVDRLINLSSAKDMSEKSLAILGNLVVTLAGKRSIEQNPTVPEQFIEITTWEESPKCQELSAYILMVLAHQCPVQRQRMAEAGIVQVLLGLALLGSALGRKRALKILQWFKEERREMRVGPHSGPQGVVGPGPEEDRMGAEEGKVLMRKIVKESLYKNLETITSRAMNGDEEGLKLKALAVSSSSNSLPY